MKTYRIGIAGCSDDLTLNQVIALISDDIDLSDDAIVNLTTDLNNGVDIWQGNNDCWYTNSYLSTWNK